VHSLLNWCNWGGYSWSVYCFYIYVFHATSGTEGTFNGLDWEPRIKSTSYKATVPMEVSNKPHSFSCVKQVWFHVYHMCNFHVWLKAKIISVHHIKWLYLFRGLINCSSYMDYFYGVFLYLWMDFWGMAIFFFCHLFEDKWVLHILDWHANDDLECVYMKSSDANASKCHLKFSSKLM